LRGHFATGERERKRENKTGKVQEGNGRKEKERKVQGFYSKANKISLVYHTNQTKKIKRAKQKKNR